MAIQSSILAWEIPWTEEPGRLRSVGSQKSQTCHSFKQKQKWDFKEVTYSKPQHWEGARLRCQLRPRKCTVKGESVSLSSVIYISLKLAISSSCIQEDFSNHSVWKRPCPLLLHYLRFPHCVCSSIVLICLTSISPVMQHILVERWPHHLITFWMPRTCSAMAHRRHLVSGSLLNKWRLSMMMEGNIEVQSTDSGAILLGFECQFFYVLAVWSQESSLTPLCLAVLICWMRIILISLLMIVVRIEWCVTSSKAFKYCLAHGEWLMRTRHLYVWVHWKWPGWVFCKIVDRAHETVVDTIMLKYFATVERLWDLPPDSPGMLPKLCDY